MGQAFRRAGGRILSSSSTSSSPSTSSSKAKTAVDRRPGVSPTDEVKVTKAAQLDIRDQSDGKPKVNTENALEERDPQYDAMLSQMLGRIKAKPGGKPEMGEAHVVERYNRPLPKLRNTKPESTRYEERAVPPGTLNVAQLRHIMLLQQGKADDHEGKMDAQQIAEKFQLDIVQLQNIIKFLSLPPEDNSKQKNQQ